MVNLLVISCSLNANSRSRILARRAHEILAAQSGVAVDWVDLQDHTLPLCGPDEAYGAGDVPALRSKIASARGVLVGVPVYNYYANAAAKNLIELTGRAWENKVVGFLCAAGGHSSYMSVMSLANSLMLDFRCLIVPRFVYASGQAFDNGSISDTEISERVEGLALELRRLTEGVG